MAENNPNSWIEAAISTATSLWQAFVVPAALAFFTLYKFRATSKNERMAEAIKEKQQGKEASKSYEQQLQEAVLASGLEARESARWLVEKQKEILDELEKDKNEGWQEKDRWQQIANICHRRWLETTSDLRQSRSLTEAMFRRLQSHGLIHEDELQKWSPIPLVPDIETIIPKEKSS